MRFSLLFFLLFLSVLSLSLSQGTYEDCCLKYVKDIGPMLKKHVHSYRRQEQDGGCNLQAVVFKLRRGKLLCARPDEKWVLDLMNQIDKKIKIKIKKKPKNGKRWH